MYEVTTPVQTEHRIGRKNLIKRIENYRFRMKKTEINFFFKTFFKNTVFEAKKQNGRGRPASRPLESV